MQFFGAIMREIIICDYDPNWVNMFEYERRQLLAILHHLSPTIEHIGSTAVPRLGAKPVIDIMIGVPNDHELDLLIVPIESLGYSYRKEHEDTMPYRRFFRKDTNGFRSHHIHAVRVAHPFWEKHLAFRDQLRTSPSDAEEYEALKRQLAARYRFDPDGYSEAKTDFVHRIIGRTSDRVLVHS
jgi:GrpB-like predicted nucleotidyltransferase (UPF0157 family)